MKLKNYSNLRILNLRNSRKHTREVIKIIKDILFKGVKVIKSN